MARAEENIELLTKFLETAPKINTKRIKDIIDLY